MQDESNETTDNVATKAKVVIRDATPDDYPLLFDAFFRIYGGRDSWFGRSVPHRILRAKMEQLLEAPQWQCIVACPSHEQDEIMGMLVFCPPTERNTRYTIGWITVKGVWQGKGVAKALLRHACINLGPDEVDCAFMMPATQRWAIQQGYRLLFKPYIPDIALWNTLQAQHKAAVKGDANE